MKKKKSIQGNSSPKSKLKSVVLKMLSSKKGKIVTTLTNLQHIPKEFFYLYI